MFACTPGAASSTIPSTASLFGSNSTSSSGSLFGATSKPHTPLTVGLPTNPPPPGSFGVPPSSTNDLFDPMAAPKGIFGAKTSSSVLESNSALPVSNLLANPPPPPPAPSTLTFGAPTPRGSGVFGLGSAAPVNNSNLFGGFGAASSNPSTLTDPFGSPATGLSTEAGLDSILNSSESLGYGLVSLGSARSASSSSAYLNSADARERTAQTVQSQFKPVDLTKEMAETYYWGRQDVTKKFALSDVNAFWLDYAEWDESLGGSFLSQVNF
jgi:hypothetical protein